jgi:hypothetical protein
MIFHKLGHDLGVAGILQCQLLQNNEEEGDDGIDVVIINQHRVADDVE